MIEYSFKINDVLVDVNNGLSIVEKLDEALDIGGVEIPMSTKNTVYDMLDIFDVLIDDIIVYSFRIAGDTMSLMSKSPYIYSHSLSLVEHTKRLERVVISGKTFTQPTDLNATQLTLWDIIDTLRLVYPLETFDNIGTTRIFSIDTTQVSYLQSVIAPEFTFKDITLREALNQVASYVDGIVRLDRNNVLSIQFYNELVDIINDELNITNRNIVQDITMYATDITVDALNVVNDESVAESVEIYPSEGGFTSARSDNYVFDFLKSYIPTPKRIYDVKKIVVPIVISMTADDGTGTFYDIYISGVHYNGDEILEIPVYEDNGLPPRIYEKNKWDLLDTDNIGRNDATKVYKSTAIYYTYGEKNITHNQTFGVFGINENISLILQLSVYQYLVSEGAYLDNGSSTPLADVQFVSTSINFIDPNIISGVDDIMYQIHYVPINKSLRFNIDRQDLTDINKQTTLMSNQQSRIVNLENFANNIQGTINKVGNTEMTLTHRVKELSDVYNIGDYTIDNYILTNKELIFFNDYINVIYELSRNFNKLSQFISVNSEIRQWEIGEKGRTLERDLLYKEYIEVDVVSSGNGSFTSQLFTDEGYKTFIDTFVSSSTREPIRGGMIQGSDIPDTVLVPLSSNGGGNSLIFNYKFDSNINAGDFKENISGQIARNFVPYTDDVGKLESFTLKMFNKLDVGVTYNDKQNRANLIPQTLSTYIDTELMRNTSPFMVYKDNREVKGFTVQQSILSKDVNKVILGRTLSLRNRLVSENPPTSIFIYKYDDFVFGKTNTLKVPDGYDFGGISILNKTVDYTNKKITINNTLSGYNSYCIADENKNIILAVNQGNGILNVITFDFKNKRSGITYDY